MGIRRPFLRTLVQTSARDDAKDWTGGFFRRLPTVGREERRETPSLSLRLRSVRHARPDSNVIRTRSNRVRFRSGCVSLQFECGMTKFAATA